MKKSIETRIEENLQNFLLKNIENQKIKLAKIWKGKNKKQKSENSKWNL